MKCDVTPRLVQLERKEMKKLYFQVRETVATDVEISPKKNSFSVADLWNTRRNIYSARKRWNSRPVILSRLG